MSMETLPRSSTDLSVTTETLPASPSSDQGERAVRNRNTSVATAAATAARVLRKRRRWAEELRSAGWRVEERSALSTETLPTEKECSSETPVSPDGDTETLHGDSPYGEGVLR